MPLSDDQSTTVDGPGEDHVGASVLVSDPDVLSQGLDIEGPRRYARTVVRAAQPPRRA
jgi:hypothetical protein